MDERRPQDASPSSSDAFGPLLSAAVFGYYGFVDSVVSQTTDSSGQTVALWVGALWIIRIATLLFAVSAGLAFRNDSRTDLVYAVGTLIATLGLVVILVWDQFDTNYQTAFHPVILILCIAWNGYSSVAALRAALR
jgi:hypothetical protein